MIVHNLSPDPHFEYLLTPLRFTAISLVSLSLFIRSQADVGFSMGSGTEVAKDASDVVLLDDSFASIGAPLHTHTHTQTTTQTTHPHTHDY